MLKTKVPSIQKQLARAMNPKAKKPPGAAKKAGKIRMPRPKGMKMPKLKGP